MAPDRAVLATMQVATTKVFRESSITIFIIVAVAVVAEAAAAAVMAIVVANYVSAISATDITAEPTIHPSFSAVHALL